MDLLFCQAYSDNNLGMIDDLHDLLLVDLHDLLLVDPLYVADFDEEGAEWGANQCAADDSWETDSDLSMESDSDSGDATMSDDNKNR